MIVVKLIGGLGNQMFQYALAKHYQLKGARVFIDPSYYRTINDNITPRQFALSALPIAVPQLSKVNDRLLNSKNIFWKILRRFIYPRLNQIVEKNLAFDPSYLQIQDNVIFTGYFQSESYFKDIESEIRKDFAFPKLSSGNLKHLSEIQQSNSVSLHIRRGDYVNNSAINKIHGSLSLSYYRSAIELIDNRVRDAKYFIFTDDPSWAHQNIKTILSDFTVVEGNLDIGNSWEDMCLISMCKHNITANSSFSWWGGWLNANPQRIIIAPQHWCTDKEMNFQTRALVPSSWIRINNYEFTQD